MIRLAVVGHGSIGRRHAQAIRDCDRAVLAAVVDPAGADCPEPVFPDIKSVDVALDGAVIATPSDLLVSVSGDAMDRGWGVLVEKPGADRVSDLEALVERARTSAPALLGYHRRYHPVVQRLKEILAEGAIGTVVGVSGIWSVKKPHDYFDAPWRKGIGGSPIRINLVHDLDVLAFLVGEIVATTALVGDPGRRRGWVDAGAVAIRFSGGAVGTMLFTDAAPSPWGFEAGTSENPHIAATGRDCYRFVGTNGAIGFPSLTLWGGAADWGQAVVSQPGPPIETIVPLAAQIEHFCDVLAGAPPKTPLSDGIGTLRAALEIEQAFQPGAVD